MFPLTDKNLIGIDIGSYSVKFVHLEGDPDSYTLKAASCVRVGKDGWERLQGPLGGFVKFHNLKGKRFAGLMSGHSLTFRHLNLHVMPEKEMKDAVKLEIIKEAGNPPDEIVCDYVLAGGEGRTSGGNTRPVIAFAAMKSDVEKTMNFYKNAGLELKVLEAVPTALLSAFDMNNSWGEGENYAMLDIGLYKSTLAILKNRRLVFAREISIGGSDLTHTFSQVLFKEEEDADEYKSVHGLDAPAGETDPLKKLLVSPLEALCSELHRSFDYYQAQFRQGHVAKIFLSGGTARLKGIEGFMTGVLGIPSFADDPFRSVNLHSNIDKDELRSIAPCMTVAAGLAARMCQA